MRNTISILDKDHKSIKEDLLQIENCLPIQGEKKLTELLRLFKDLERFTTSGHHKREDEILFSWMLEQNSNSDASIIKRIKSEHDELENKQRLIIACLEKQIPGKSGDSLVGISFDIRDFIDLYREHIEIEDGFIYLIADALITSNQR